MDRDLINAFKTARYIVLKPRIEIKIGKKNQDLDKLLARHKSKSWAFITPFNPGSQIISDPENELRFKSLKKEVRKYKKFEGEGGGQDKKWPLEKSLLIMDINLPKAKSIGNRFGQDAVVFGYIHKPAQLIILN